jgi:hypothetical protein
VALWCARTRCGQGASSEIFVGINARMAGKPRTTSGEGLVRPGHTATRTVEAGFLVNGSGRGMVRGRPWRAGRAIAGDGPERCMGGMLVDYLTRRSLHRLISLLGRIVLVFLRRS